MAQSKMQMSDEALQALRSLAETAMDGYRLMDMTGFEPDVLARAISELLDESLVEVKGDVAPDHIGDAYLFVPPNAHGHVKYLLQQLRSSKA